MIKYVFLKNPVYHDIPSVMENNPIRGTNQSCSKFKMLYQKETTVLKL